MSVKVIMLRKKLKSKLEERSALSKRAEELIAAIEAAAEVDPELESQVDEVENAQTAVEEAIANLEAAIAEEEDATATAVETAIDAASTTGKEDDPPVRSRAKIISNPAGSSGFNCRSRLFTSRAQRDAFYARSEVKNWLNDIRALGANGVRRSVNGAQLGIPEIVLNALRDNINSYSKLVKYVHLVPVKGTARQLVVGDIPEGIWTEMGAVLNELEFVLNQVEVDGYGVGGYIPVPNWLLRDSDINLGEEIVYALGQAVGYALDKAIVYGKGAASHMPIGFVTRLAETSQPSYWDANRAPWTDLHSSNIIKLNIANEVGTAFYVPLVTALGKASRKLGNGKKLWLMNETTHNILLAKAAGFDSSATLVSQLTDTMPVIGGKVELLDFIPDNEIVGGFLDEYLLAEREGGEISSSDQVMWLRNATCFKGSARYDGQPVRGEAYVAVNFANTNVTTAVEFGTDYANTPMNVLVCTAAAHGSTSGATIVTVSGAKADTPTLKYALKHPGGIAPGMTLAKVGGTWTSLTSGSTAISAAAGTPITVVELDSKSKIVSAGTVNSVPKS